jgi:hypothetical protein
MFEHFLPIFDKVKAASLAAGISAGIVGSIVGVVPELEAVAAELKVVLDFVVSSVIIGAVTFIAGYFKEERAVRVLPKE